MKIFVQFFILGLYSFGGPAAHIGFFQREFVEKKGWLDQSSFSQAVALCQFLPGPASSQLGMYIGYRKGGYLGALAAFLGFTFPSFALLTAAAMLANTQIETTQSLTLLITAAKWLAVIVVTDAVWGMAAKNLTSRSSLLVFGLSAIWLALSSGLAAQLVPIVTAALVGYTMAGKAPTTDTPWRLTGRPVWGLLALFMLLLVGMPFLGQYNPFAALFNAFYQAGAFVFGGGHVVLPLLEPLLDGMVDSETFITGYASAQLVPGPMFTMASYLGAASQATSPILGSVVATLAVFLPGALLLFAVIPVWESLMSHPRLKVSIQWVNASVVALLAVALINPIGTSAIGGVSDVAICLLGFGLLKKAKVPVWGLAMALFASAWGISLLG
uniref:chromate efflux transporter n=1 Tax=Thaumasiovibrio occultus TaxID=1891184 RepID=UPI000B3544B6|nr:chromate efflux transporter [Thaumasiovibrio occultus]